MHHWLPGVIGFRRQAACGTLLRTFSEIPVTTVSATEARRRLYALIDEVGQSHQPVQIQGKRGNAVLISEADWRSIEETLHLLAIPGMRESILEGMATEASELTPEACPQTRLRVACSKAEGPGPTKP